MSLQRTVSPVLFAAAVLLTSAAAAQQQGEMTLFSNPSYSGSRYTVTGPNMNIRLGWTVRSVIIAQGDQWQLCSGPAYKGDCTTLSGNARSFGLVVASARPAGPTTRPTPIPDGVTTLPAPIPPGGGFAGPSLRGMSAEFFRAPSSNGQRVISCPQGSAACAADSADRYCRERGWTASSYERQETVAGRNYLADVLCTRTGR